MRCLECGSEAVTERPERTAQGDRRFRCRTCSKQFNARSGGCPRSAARFCHAHDELRHVLRPHSRPHQHVPVDGRRLVHLRRTVTVLAIMEAA
jgi:transposase-like protein